MNNIEDNSNIHAAELRAKEKRYWLERALNLLSRREHSAVELRQKLLAKECDSQLVDDIIATCLHKNYLNIERFAEVFARHQAQLGYGPKKVQYLLTQHQVPSDVIGYVMNDTDFSQAKEVALRKIGSKDAIKLKSALYRRGF